MFSIRKLGAHLLTALRPSRTKPACRSTKQPNRFHPRLEGLDERIVPDSETWTNFGGDGLASNPANWSTYHIPQPYDLVGFDGAESNADCYGLFGDNLQVSLSAEIASGVPYTGTVTFTQTSALMALVLETGTVAQAPGVDLSVNYGLQWHAPGALNPEGSSNSLHVLPSASANIDPMGGTIVTGDTLTFECSSNQGAQGTFNPGTVQFNNAAGAIVGSNIAAAFPATVTVKGIQNWRNKPVLKVLQGGSVEAVGTGTWTDTGAVWIAGGVFKLSNGAIASFADHSDPNNPNTASVAMTAGNIYLENGTNLIATFGVGMGAGKLSTLATGSGDQTATIGGDVKNTGADVVIDDGSTPHVFGTLQVNGNVWEQGGTYRPVIDGGTNRQSDCWTSTGAFTIGGTAALAPGTVNAVQPNFTWIYIQGNTIAGMFATTNLQYGPGPNDKYTIGSIGNPATAYTLNT